MVDSSVANSSGYFKDPVTKEDFSIDTPRVVECKFENGKFTWPMVMTSAGEPVKIVYKYFTDKEKELYKAYRGRSGSGTSVRKPVEKKLPEPVKKTETVKKETGYNKESAVSKTIEDIIAHCDMYLGVSYIDGVAHSIITKRGTATQWHIPRSLIKDSDMKRLCGGTV